MQQDKIEIALETYVTKVITLKRYINEQIVPRKQGMHLLTEQNSHSICPFHDETKASFNYWGTTDTCYCFGCGVGGDLIAIHRQFVKQYENRQIDRKRATRELIALYNLQNDATVQRYTEQLQDALVELQQNMFVDARRRLTHTAIIDSTLPITIPRFSALQRQYSSLADIETRCLCYQDIDIRAGLAYIENRGRPV